MKGYLWNIYKMKALFVMLVLSFVFLSEGTTISVNATESTFTGVSNQTSGDLTWSITSDGKLIISGTGNYVRNSADKYNGYNPPWYAYKDYILTAEVSVTGITSMERMFYALPNLITVDFKNTDTSQVTTMKDMFVKCTSLKNLDLSGLNTSNVTDMSEMFNMCTSLESLTLKSQDPNDTKFSTASVTDMSNMFANCNKLSALDVSGFDTSSVTNMASIFGGCKTIKTLDVSNFDTSNVTNMGGMFANCNDLETLTLGSNFNVDKVEYMNSMFIYCYALKEIDLSTFRTSPGVEGAVTDMTGMFDNCRQLKRVIFPDRFDTSNVTSMAVMFYKCGSLEEVDMSGLDTSKVKRMNQMFDECISLTKLDISNFNTSSVEEMHYMFRKCESLQSLDLSHFDTANVTSMSAMFQNCYDLQSLDISSFNTSENEYVWSMFENCYELQSIDVSNFDTTKIQNMEAMFKNCYKLQSIDVSSFNTSNVNNMKDMFYGCNAITELDLSSFDTSKYTEDDEFVLQMNNLTKITTGKDKRAYRLVTKGENWIDDAGNMYLDDATIEPESNTTLYVHSGICDINYIYEGELVDCPTTYNVGTALPLSGYVIKEHYTFEGWYEDKQFTKKITEISADRYRDITLYAKMSPERYVITYKNLEGVSNADNLPTSYTYGQKLELISPVKTSYLFEGWYEDEQLTKKITEIPAERYGDITLYAKMSLETYSITYMNIEGISNADVLPTSYIRGENVELNSPVKTCYQFEGWYSDKELTHKVTAITPDTSGDILLYAKWTVCHAVDRENGVVTKEATTVAEGEIQYKCKNCDYTETEKLPRIVTEESKITDETIMNSVSDGDIKGSDFTKFQARADKTTKSTIRLKWNKVDDADGYKIYGNKCGKKNKCELLKIVKDGAKTTFKQKKLKKGTYYKFIVRAYKLVDDEEITLAVSKTIHAATDGGKKGNAKSVKIKTDKKMKKASSGYKLALKSNKKYTIKATEVAAEKKISRHRKIRFESTDKNIAQVSFLGKVTTKNPGTCYIYVYAQNGIYKKIKVVVK